MSQNDFENRGWQAMAKLLDKELPQKKKRRILPLFWLSSIAVSLILIAYASIAFIGDNKQQKSSEKELVVVQSTNSNTNVESQPNQLVENSDLSLVGHTNENDLILESLPVQPSNVKSENITTNPNLSTPQPEEVNLNIKEEKISHKNSNLYANSEFKNKILDNRTISVKIDDDHPISLRESKEFSEIANASLDDKSTDEKPFKTAFEISKTKINNAENKLELETENKSLGEPNPLIDIALITNPAKYILVNNSFNITLSEKTEPDIIAKKLSLTHQLYGVFSYASSEILGNEGGLRYSMSIPINNRIKLASNFGIAYESTTEKFILPNTTSFVASQVSTKGTAGTQETFSQRFSTRIGIDFIMNRFIFENLSFLVGSGMKIAMPKSENLAFKSAAEQDASVNNVQPVKNEFKGFGNFLNLGLEFNFRKMKLNVAYQPTLSPYRALISPNPNIESYFALGLGYTLN
jgi:hypothetical protein